eukprot:1025851-Rhodomonas_salina.2
MVEGEPAKQIRLPLTPRKRARQNIHMLDPKEKPTSGGRSWHNDTSSATSSRSAPGELGMESNTLRLLFPTTFKYSSASTTPALRHVSVESGGDRAKPRGLHPASTPTDQ